MKADQSFLAPANVFEKLHSLCNARVIEGATVVFLQGEAPREVLLVLRGDIALTPDATQPNLCRVAGPGSILGLPANLSSRPLRSYRGHGRSLRNCLRTSQAIY